MRFRTPHLNVIRDTTFETIRRLVPKELAPYLRITNKSSRHAFEFAADLVFARGKETLLAGRTKGGKLVLYPMHEEAFAEDVNKAQLGVQVEDFVDEILTTRLFKLVDRYRINEPFGDLPYVRAVREEDNTIRVSLGHLDQAAFKRLVRAVPEILALPPNSVMLPRTKGATIWERIGVTTDHVVETDDGE